MCYMIDLSGFRRRLPIKKWCLVLAIINAVVNAVVFVMSFYVLCRIFTPKPHTGGGFKAGGIVWGRRKRSINDYIDDQFRYQLLPIMEFFTILTVICSLLAVIFSIMVCIGIRKRRPGLVNAYVVYGVVVSWLIFAILMLMLFTVNSPGISIGGLFALALHALYIVLVYQTRVKLQEEAMADHIRLQEINDYDTKSDAPMFVNEKC